MDIKNFQGDYYFKSDKLYTLSNNRECKNPVDQLKRSTTLFRQLLQNLRQNYLIESYVIFINPEFTLYQAPMDQPFILPTQVKRFLQDLNKTTSKLNTGHQRLAQTLISLHQTKHPFSKLPIYHYNQLKKGTYCSNCKSFRVSIQNSSLICKTCGQTENIEQAILRNIKEFQLLFPEERITTSNIHHWSDLSLNPKTVSRILKKNFTAIGNKRSTYFK